MLLLQEIAVMLQERPFRAGHAGSGNVLPPGCSGHSPIIPSVTMEGQLGLFSRSPVDATDMSGYLFLGSSLGAPSTIALASSC